MSILSIQSKINRLPPALLGEVEQFLDNLLSQKRTDSLSEQKVIESVNKVYANTDCTLDSELMLMQNNSIGKEDW